MGQVLEEKLLALLSGPVGWVDLAYGALLVWGALGGLKNGLKGEIGKFSALWIAVVVASRYADSVAASFSARTGFPAPAASVLGLLSFTFGIYFALDTVAAFSAKIAHIEFMGMLNRLGGLGLGMSRITLLAFVLSKAVLSIPSTWVQHSFLERSYTGHFLAAGVETVNAGTRKVFPVDVLLPLF